MSDVVQPVVGALSLARVIDNADPEHRGQVKVQLLAMQLELWAAVATASAGGSYGVQALPRKDELVVVAFVSPELPIVLGSLWTGSKQPHTEQGPVEQRYAVVTPRGTRISCDDASPESVTVRTPAGNAFVLSDQAGGNARIDVQGTTIEISPLNVEVRASGSVSILAMQQVNVSAPSVAVDAAISRFSGIVKCDVLQSQCVISTSYSPGMGNIW